MKRDHPSASFLRRPLKVSLCWLLCLVLLKPALAQGLELVTAYASVIYPDREILGRFNDRIFLGRLRYHMPDTSGELEDDVRAKIDLITHQVQSVLDMYPKELHYSIYLLKNREEVVQMHKALYRNPKDYVAFYAPRMNTVYLSPDRLNINVLAHELGHVVVENFFDTKKKKKIHEILAQFAEKNLGN